MKSNHGNTGEYATAAGLIYAITFELAIPALFMWVSGNWLWVEGWTFSIWFIFLCVPFSVWLFFKNPSLFSERIKPSKSNQKLWDRVFTTLLMLVFFAWVVMMPLDVSRFHWSPAFPVWLEVIGGIILLPAWVLFIKCYIDNPYLSAVVRIQDDRDQKVISTGVYGFVRHPMYLAGILMFVGVPMLLGSLLGFVFSILFTVGIIYRILGEEKMLETELEGYIDYKKKIRYRLLPFVW